MFFLIYRKGFAAKFPNWFLTENVIYSQLWILKNLENWRIDVIMRWMLVYICIWWIFMVLKWNITEYNLCVACHKCCYVSVSFCSTCFFSIIVLYEQVRPAYMGVSDISGTHFTHSLCDYILVWCDGTHVCRLGRPELRV